VRRPAERPAGDTLAGVRVFLVTLVLGLSVACASGDPSDASRAREVEAQVWSPYCPGRLLIDCGTEQAHDLREQIASRVERGESTAEVLVWVRREYGDQAIARPAASGAGLLIWLVPAAIFLLGAGLVVRFVSRNVEHPSEHPDQEELHADP
jgi:cytochrome c-type biogenesis protein CcmH